jgi:proline iminopeptidase
VQGRYDMICPPVSAWTLSRHWKRSELRMIPVAGHALSEPGISAELIRIMDGLRQ